jgi:hypothetical protein
MEGHWALKDVALDMRRVSGSIPRYLTPMQATMHPSTLVHIQSSAVG